MRCGALPRRLGSRAAVTPDPILRFGHSPDPDDAFMFFGLAEGAVTIRDYGVEHVVNSIIRPVRSIEGLAPNRTKVARASSSS